MGIPMRMLPQPVENSGDFGRIAVGIPGLEAFSGVHICGSAGDQQAALFGQGGFLPGQVKNTYGTGCFALMNTGAASVVSQNGLLSSIGWTVGGETAYVLEGSVFNAGSGIQWLRDELGIIGEASDCDALAESVTENDGVYFVSAFTGLGAPHWDMYARGTLLGVTRGTGRGHLCRAVLEGIAYQSGDLLRAMEKDAGRKIQSLRVDGGACVSDFMMQFQADLLQIPVERPGMVETTAWGAACLAGLGAGVWQGIEALSGKSSTGRVFLPERDCGKQWKAWHKAVARAKDWEEN